MMSIALISIFLRINIYNCFTIHNKTTIIFFLQLKTRLLSVIFISLQDLFYRANMNLIQSNYTIGKISFYIFNV